MSWTDEELDKLFSDSAGDMTFEYKKEYFKDIEKHLPISRKRDFLWNGVSLFMGAVVVYLMIQPTTAETDVLKLHSDRKLAQHNIAVPEVTTMLTANDKSISGDVAEFNAIESEILSGAKENEFNELVSEVKLMAPELILTEQITNVENDNPVLLTQNAVDFIDQDVLTADMRNDIELVDRIDLTPRLDFFVQGIGGIGQGKMLPGEKVSKLTGLGVGVEYNRNRLSASFAVNGMISHHDGMELSRVSKVYGFGSTEYKSMIEYSKLFMAESELTVGYRMGRVTAFGGLNVNYLATTECAITNSTNDEVKFDDIRKVYGYNTGLKHWGLKPMIGMSYDFKNGVQLGANLGAQVIETVEPEYLEGISRPMPLEGRLYLRWKF